ncbi:hypothetical protein B0T19DRAFT_36498 [Cercophora scortea]|uniref:PNPLA domain-containing protein n=1 Tax=Cercophora scortea TaxID=314031 RepID=A0AAE0J3S8_9PEZI|nr:hypothetical protein B0T19DRAFT_36498 [Cercophora scortea]
MSYSREIRAQAAGTTSDDDLVAQFQEMAIPGAVEGDDMDAARPRPRPRPRGTMASESSQGPNNPAVSWGSGLWEKPSPTFIAEQAQKAGIELVCRFGRSCCRPSEGTESFVLCGGCGPSHQPAHRACLARFQTHRPQAGARGIVTCHEVDFHDFVHTSWLLDSNFMDQDKESLHIQDIWSTWFGIPHDQEGPFPQLHVFPRLQTLLDAADSSAKPPRQYPSLISFVGDTGSGKSTLIRAIIRMSAPRHHKAYHTPVPGAAFDEFDSTSSDVHLFADPGTLFKESPLMFVDCEGFSGTDTPVACRILAEASRREGPQPLRDGTLRNATSARPAKDLVSEHANTASSRIDLRWGQVVAPVPLPTDSLSRRRTIGQVDPESRKLVVKSLYPRLLYAFSDVVCFVTTNSRAAQTILEEMFTWAKEGHEKTLNQRVRPGLVIVLNKMDQSSQNSLATVDNATRRLMQSFERSSRFQELQKKWKQRDKTINTAEELIGCYYHSFRVIPIPQHSTSSPVTSRRISTQIKILYDEVLKMSTTIRRKRQSLNMDFDVSMLNAYLVQSITTLAKNYNNALDFHRLADLDTALPRRFSEHLLQIMSNMVKLRGLDVTQEVGGEAKLIGDLIPYIASCIVAQLNFGNGRGNPRFEEAFRKRKEDLVEEARRGLEGFRDRYWRCEAKDATDQRRCKNYSIGHDKGHQFDPTLRDHRISDVSSSDDDLRDGDYFSKYLPEEYANKLWDEISHIQTLEDAMDKLASTAIASGVSQITGQRTCLACLSNTPTNMLPCRPRQHGICQECIRRYTGSTRHLSFIAIDSCPLGCQLERKPWTIRVKPKTAGARILVLDGGGIRGIVELMILSEIEKAIGHRIRIQDLFDLVIGTSTGGIVALGVFDRRWALSDAISRFRSLAANAFKYRKALRVPVFSKIAEPFCDYKYTTEGINSTLQGSFGDGYLFGQQTNSLPVGGDQVKVGVVSCHEGRAQPALIANYSRNPIQRDRDGRDGYDWLQREDEQDKDFRRWQAARATSAAQTLFTPYEHEATSRRYVDGATVRNNPVRLAYDEYKRIWPSSTLMEPDIIVSIGTSIHVDEEGRVKNSRSARLESVKRLLPSGVRKKVETGLDMVEATLDCHREWVEFKETTRGRLRANSHRLDVGLFDKPPPLDAPDRMHKLESDCQNYLSRESIEKRRPPYMDSNYASAHEHIKAVAGRLLASLFYMEHILPEDMEGSYYESVIHCRLTPQSESAVSLLALKPEFRLREVDINNIPYVRPIGFAHPEQRFNERTLSAEIEFEVSGGKFTRFVEVQFKHRRGSSWEPIGGF